MDMSIAGSGNSATVITSVRWCGVRQQNVAIPGPFLIFTGHATVARKPLAFVLGAELGRAGRGIPSPGVHSDGNATGIWVREAQRGFSLNSITRLRSTESNPMRRPKPTFHGTWHADSRSVVPKLPVGAPV